LPAYVDIHKETVIYGVVSKGDAPLPGAYVRLLDANGEFAAEVVSSATGGYRFFAAPGMWLLSVLHREGSFHREVHALEPGLVEASIAIS
jgi:hypothetical protein